MRMAMAFMLSKSPSSFSEFKLLVHAGTGAVRAVLGHASRLVRFRYVRLPNLAFADVNKWRCVFIR